MAIDLRVNNGTTNQPYYRPIDPQRWHARCLDIGGHTYGRMLRWEPCAYCGKCPQRGHHPLSRTVDHIIPVSQGGAKGLLNQAACCRICNQFKGTRSVLEVIVHRRRQYSSGIGWVTPKKAGKIRSPLERGSPWEEWSRTFKPRVIR